jgi:hypothetical protein
LLRSEIVNQDFWDLVVRQLSVFNEELGQFRGYEL